MELDIRAGKRVLYKHCGQWAVGTLEESNAQSLTGVGLFLRIIPKDEENIVHIAEINEIFFDTHPVEDWMKQYHNLMTKEEYIKFIDSEDFERNTEEAWVSDGEYYYYPITKFTANWIMKQPFDYVVRNN